MVNGKVIQRTIGPDGQVTGTYDNNPFLNSIIYDVEFPDGQVKEYAANIIAENMLTQVDSDGMSTTLMEAIVDHRRDDEKALQHHDKYIQTKNGRRHLRKTTKGWELLIKWKDKSESWIKLADMKESHPVEVAEYARARGIDKEPAFEWWVPHTLKKRQVILSALKKRIRKTTHKYGIEIPTSVEHAFELDRKNGNNLWKDALEMEMYNIGVAFEILEDGKTAPAGYTKVSGHLIWSVKMDFTRKARWVLDGHKTPDPVGSKYAGVVSRESVRIAFTYAALNDLDVCMADIRNAYLQSPTSQKHYIICGPEFGMENLGKVAIMHRAVYGGKTSGRDFRNHLRSCMEFINFTSCPADPDVWMRPAIKSDGTKCYDYVLLYVDDALVVSENAESILRNELMIMNFLRGVFEYEPKQRLVESAMYSASVVDRAIIICILDAQVIGAPAKRTIHPDLDLAVIGSTWASLWRQLPEKSASTQQSKFQGALGLMIKPLSRVPKRYLPICLTASAWHRFGCSVNRVH